MDRYMPLRHVHDGGVVDTSRVKILQNANSLVAAANTMTAQQHWKTAQQLEGFLGYRLFRGRFVWSARHDSKSRDITSTRNVYRTVEARDTSCSRAHDCIFLEQPPCTAPIVVRSRVTCR
jgi:hypothetical protein